MNSSYLSAIWFGFRWKGGCFNNGKVQTKSLPGGRQNRGGRILAQLQRWIPSTWWVLQLVSLSSSILRISLSAPWIEYKSCSVWLESMSNFTVLEYFKEWRKKLCLNSPEQSNWTFFYFERWTIYENWIVMPIPALIPPSSKFTFLDQRILRHGRIIQPKKSKNKKKHENCSLCR